jgi:hypothetical protein
MKIRITRKNGFRGYGVDAGFGSIIEVSAASGVSMIAEGVAVPVESRAEAAEDVAPVTVAAQNGAAKRWKKK